MQKLGKPFIILGILIMLIPFLGGVYTRYQQAQYYKAYEEKNNALEESFRGLEEEEDEQMEQQESEGVRIDDSATEVPVGEVIGKINIPKIDSELLLIEGAGKKELKIGAGHMTDTAMPGEVGNCAIAGHRSYTFAKMWNRLNEVELGDVIEITQGKNQYTYIVDDIFIVEPDEVEVLTPQKDKRIVTLITCEPVVKATHRLIVRGTLKED